jgi:hypothetical protein
VRQITFVNDRTTTIRQPVRKVGLVGAARKVTITDVCRQVTVSRSPRTLSLQRIVRTVSPVRPVRTVTVIQGLQGRRGPAGAASNVSAKNKALATITAGQPVTTHSSGVGVVLADATSSGHAAIGLMLANTLSMDMGEVQTAGEFELSDWSEITGTTELSPKASYFLGITAGTLTTTSPTNNPYGSQRVGVAVSPTSLLIGVEQYVQL